MPKIDFRQLPPQIMLAPMTTYSSLPDGQISPDELPYLEARARGGFDWIITAACCVHPSGWSFDGQWQASGREFLPSLNSAAEAIHRGGARAILQIHHGGRQAPSRLCGGSVSASAIPSERPNAETPRALTIPEIEELVLAYANAATLAAEAGYDGVEIHGANTYLIQQFVSPHSNRREDRYGQDRLLFSEEVTRAVISAVSETLVVGYRLSPEELETPGIRLADTRALLDRLAPLGLDFLHISLRRFDQPSAHEASGEPILSQLTRHLADRVPLVGVGAITTWADVEQTLALGAHSVAIGRMAITNPNWPILAKSGAQIRTHVPAEGAEQSLILPKGLANKIYATDGWFPVEGKASPSE